MGYLIMNEGEMNTSTMTSACGNPFTFTQNERDFSHVYFCEIIVQNLCYDYIADFYLESV